MFKHYVKRAVKKVVVLPFFIILFIVRLIIKPLSALIHFISIPLSIITTGIAAIIYFNNGALNVIVQTLLLSGIFIGIYLITLKISSFTYRTYNKLYAIVSRPIVIKPPVRFTL